MKMTLHIDEALLARVMAATGVTRNTRAIDLALREMDQKAKLAALCAEGLGLGADQLQDAIEPGYNLKKMRMAETPVYYGRKPRTRRR